MTRKIDNPLLIFRSGVSYSFDKDVREKIKLVKEAPSSEIGTEQRNTPNSIVKTLTSLVNTRQ
jgi:hypothetical protein